MELNGFFASKRIQMGDLCERTAEEGEDKRVGGSRNSICVGTKVAYCDNQSRRWEEDRDCEIPGYVCGAVRQKCTVYGGWKLGITCVRP